VIERFLHRAGNVISNKINMKFYDNSPQRQVNIRIEYPVYYFLKEEAAHNNMTITELVRHYFAEGFGRKRAETILEQARNKTKTMESNKQ
jgi:hypothetical protein